MSCSSAKYEPTIGADFRAASMLVNSKDVNVNVWDLGGHADFGDVREEFYKESQAGILAFDVNMRKSYQNLESWLSEAKRCCPHDLPFVVV